MFSKVISGLQVTTILRMVILLQTGLLSALFIFEFFVFLFVPGVAPSELSVSGGKQNLYAPFPVNAFVIKEIP